jgi:hypothetical protein
MHHFSFFLQMPSVTTLTLDAMCGDDWDTFECPLVLPSALSTKGSTCAAFRSELRKMTLPQLDMIEAGKDQKWLIPIELDRLTREILRVKLVRAFRVSRLQIKDALEVALFGEAPTKKNKSKVKQTMQWIGTYGAVHTVPDAADDVRTSIILNMYEPDTERRCKLSIKNWSVDLRCKLLYAMFEEGRRKAAAPGPFDAFVSFATVQSMPAPKERVRMVQSPDGIDYCGSVPIKCALNGDSFDGRLYERDAGKWSSMMAVHRAKMMKEEKITDVASTMDKHRVALTMGELTSIRCEQDDVMDEMRRKRHFAC